MSVYNHVCVHMCVHVFERPNEHKDKFNFFPSLKCWGEYKTRKHEVAQGVKMFAFQPPEFNPQYLHVKRKESPTQTFLNMLRLTCMLHTHIYLHLWSLIHLHWCCRWEKFFVNFRTRLWSLLGVNLGVVDSPSWVDDRWDVQGVWLIASVNMTA